MNITQIKDGQIAYQNIHKPTDADMQNEYNYILAGQMTRKLLDQGLISVEEFNKIMAKNRRSFSPFISKIIP